MTGIPRHGGAHLLQQHKSAAGRGRSAAAAALAAALTLALVADDAVARWQPSLSLAARWQRDRHLGKDGDTTALLSPLCPTSESASMLKDRHRSVLGDGRVLDALVSRQAVDVFANGAVSFRELELRL